MTERGDASWAELAWADQPSCLTAGPQADLGWWPLGSLGPLARGPGCIWKEPLFTGWRDVYRKRLFWKAVW